MSKRGLTGLLTSLPGNNKRRNISEEAHDEVTDHKSYVQGPMDKKFGQRRAFPIKLDLGSVDLNKVPKTVDEYLAQVRFQAMEMNDNNFGGTDSDDEIVYFKKPESVVGKQDGDEFRNEKSLSGKSFPLLDEFVANFAVSKADYDEFRKNLHELDAIDLPTTAKEWKTFIWETSCEREYVAQIVEEEQHIKLLVYFTKWMGSNIDANYSEWVIAMLAAIESETLTTTELSVIRQLGKRAFKQHQNNESEVFFKQLVAIVGIYFKQRDLLEISYS